MANSTPNAVYSGQGPSQTGQILAQGVTAGSFAQAIFGSATITGDNSGTSAVINLIDGTKTINFTPSFALVAHSGGTSTGTVEVVNAVVTNQTITITTSANIGVGTYIVSFMLLP